MTLNGVVCRVCGEEYMGKRRFCGQECARTYYLGQRIMSDDYFEGDED